MPDVGYIALMVVVSSAVTWALRALPFVALAPLRHSALVKYLSVHMPVGVMLILMVYAMRRDSNEVRDYLWLAVAVLVTAGIHLWRSNALVSILVGTALYVVLVSVW